MPPGPWSEARTILQNNLDPAQNMSDWDTYVTNPSAQLLPSGEVMLVFSSVVCGPTAWTIARHNAPNHLGL